MGRAAKLALFGGAPAFTEPLHVGRPNIVDRGRFLLRINEILDSRWLTNHGPYEAEFERRIAEFVGAKHCIAVCNATVGLEIVARACQLAGEVIMPSFTFVATAHAMRWMGLEPIFCDIEPERHGLDPIKVADVITPRTSAILAVHLWGQPCRTQALADLAALHGLRIIYDAAHAFGCSDGGRMIGSFGDAEVFSFHATKFVNSFEGGAITTNNDDIAEACRLMRNFGFAGLDRVVSVGTNGKMNELAAAMGLTSLESVDDFVEANHVNYRSYEDELRGLPGFRLMAFDSTNLHNFQYIVIEVDETQTDISRDRLIEVLWQENVLARRYFFPGCHNMEPYRSQFTRRDTLAVTEDVMRRVIVLPNGTAVTPTDILRIGRILATAVENPRAVNEKLGELERQGLWRSQAPVVAPAAFAVDSAE